MPRNYKFYPKTACHVEMHKVSRILEGILTSSLYWPAEEAAACCPGSWHVPFHRMAGHLSTLRQHLRQLLIPAAVQWTCSNCHALHDRPHEQQPLRFGLSEG